MWKILTCYPQLLSVKITPTGYIWDQKIVNVVVETHFIPNNTDLIFY